MGYSTPKELACEKPQPECAIQVFKGKAIDSSYDKSELYGYYIKFDKVINLSSEKEEFDVVLHKNNKSYVTVNADGVQRLRRYRYIEYNRFEYEEQINFEKEGHYGSISFGKGDEVAFAFQPINDPKDAKQFKKKIVYPTNEAIGKSRIYIGTLEGTTLKAKQMLHELDTLDDDVWESQPAFGPNGNVIVFASNRSGGFGGVDLWYIYKKKDGEWSVPINCGSLINTACDEITPFIDKNGKTLYFSSMGHETVGGYDLFASNINPKFWINAPKGIGLSDKDNFTKAVNLKPPMNTKFDEIFPSCEDCDSIMYYSSNQADKSKEYEDLLVGFDNYYKAKLHVKKLEVGSKRKKEELALDVKVDDPVFKTDEPVIDFTPDPEVLVPAVPPIKFELFGKVENPETGELIANAVITARKTSNFELVSQTTSDAYGNYAIDLIKGEELEITTQASNLFYDSFRIKVEKEDTVTSIKRDLKPPVKLVIRINFPYDDYQNPYPFTLDSNGIETNKKWENEIDQLAENLLNKNEKFKYVLIEGHTDDQASIDYNKKLGQNRAEFIQSELIKRGVDRKMIKCISAGKQKPLPKRESEDIEILRKRLRRVTIEKVF
jgi:hypothetical protein